MWWLAASAAAVGTFLQRSTGLGLGLVALPMLVPAVGSLQAVRVVNVLSCVVCLAAASRQRAFIRWRVTFPLTAAGTIATLFGSYLARRLPPKPTQLVVGVAIATLAAAFFAGRRPRILASNGAAWGCGFVSGLLGSVAGVGGPAASMYLVNRGIDARAVVATVQFHTAIVSGASVVLRGIPALAASQVVTLTSAALIGWLAATAARSLRLVASAQLTAIGLGISLAAGLWLVVNVLARP